MLTLLIIVVFLIGFSSYFAIRIGKNKKKERWRHYLYPFLGIPFWFFLHSLDVGKGISGANFVIEMFWIFIVSVTIPWLSLLMGKTDLKSLSILSFALTFLPLVVTLCLRLTMPLLPEKAVAYNIRFHSDAASLRRVKRVVKALFMNNKAGKYDDPELEAEWLQEQRNQIEAYLIKEGIEHGAIAEKPDWFVAPYVSIWRIGSYANPKTTGWWAISGDLPTYYCSSNGVEDARSAMYHFAKIWDEVSECMIQGKPHPDVTIGNEDNWTELGDLLKRRSMILSDWAKDDELWY